MRYHIDRTRGFNPVLAFQFKGPPPHYAPLQPNADPAMRQTGSPAPRSTPRQSRRPESAPRDNPSADEHPMIAALYERHLAMQEMLAVFAELRGDDP